MLLINKQHLDPIDPCNVHNVHKDLIGELRRNVRRLIQFLIEGVGRIDEGAVSNLEKQVFLWYTFPQT